MSHLSFDMKVRIVGTLVEGTSIRAAERLHQTHRDTIMRLGLTIGGACLNLHDNLMTDLQVNVLEVDEIWSFIGKKQKRVRPDDDPDLGDQYTFIGLDANKKAIVSFLVGKRDGVSTDNFALDLRQRILNRPQITSDGFKPYLEAIEMAFGRGGADFAQIVKVYGHIEDDDHKYSPPKCIGAQRNIISGKPAWENISTSYVERQNLTMRMQMRRFTRLTNAFSKRLPNHRAAVSLYVCWYNFCRVHETLKTTPAVAIGVADHVWSLAELVDTALSMAPRSGDPSPVSAMPVPSLTAGGPRLALLQGGRVS